MEHNGVKKLKVLYVEDDPDVRFATSQILKLLGYNVECANNGKLGVEKALTWQPDIILMDVRMPVMSGPKAIRILRDHPDTALTPILVLTAHADAKTRSECKKAGADKIFQKVADADRLDTVIKYTYKQKTCNGN